MCQERRLVFRWIFCCISRLYAVSESQQAYQYIVRSVGGHWSLVRYVIILSCYQKLIRGPKVDMCVKSLSAKKYINVQNQHFHTPGVKTDCVMTVLNVCHLRSWSRSSLWLGLN